MDKENLMKNVLLTSIAALGVSVSAYGDYQFEGNIGYNQGDVEDLDFDGYSLSASVYFDVVDDSKGPLREAAFLDKASNVSLSFATSEFDDFGDSDDISAISTRIVIQEDWIVVGAYTDLDADELFSIGAGAYLSDTSDVIVSYSRLADGDFDSLGVTFHSLTHLGAGSAISSDIGFSYIDSDENGYSAIGSVTYYPLSQLGFGANVVRTSLNDIDTTALSIFAEYFFNQNISGEISYTTSDEDIDNDSFGSFTTDTIAIEVTGRF